METLKELKNIEFIHEFKFLSKIVDIVFKEESVDALCEVISDFYN